MGQSSSEMKRSISAVRSVGDLNFTGQRVLGRFDLNVPLLPDGGMSDTTRVDATIPTIRHIIDGKPAMLTIMSHLGRPQGRADPAFSLRPIADYLSQMLGQKVH